SGAGSQKLELNPGQAKTVVMQTQGGWYDLKLTAAADPKLLRILAGRLDDGRALTSDPRL
ncbi:MAG TPA: hypothetical protein VIG76_09965, partial [Amnibacterium sp.]|uniref:hypothetical protein n=1 Tax=Amnibacterium sp. TaxID=1872496 RepID=UPI002F91FC36